MKDSKELNNLSNVMTNGFNEQLNLAKGFLNLNKKSKSNKEIVKLNKEQLNNKIMIDMVLDENLLNLNGEERWQTIGMVKGVLMLLVAHTIFDEDDCEIIRIISAREVTKAERNQYEHG